MVSDTLQQFLQQRLPSLEQIEIVLLLRRDPSRAWSAPEVAQDLRMPPESAAMRLFLLASGGMLSFEATGGAPRYRFMAGDEAADVLLAELAELYESDRNGVAAAVGAPPDPIRSFADAFKLKK